MKAVVISKICGEIKILSVDGEIALECFVHHRQVITVDINVSHETYVSL